MYNYIPVVLEYRSVLYIQVQSRGAYKDEELCLLIVTVEGLGNFLLFLSGNFESERGFFDVTSSKFQVWN